MSYLEDLILTRGTISVLCIATSVLISLTAVAADRGADTPALKLSMSKSLMSASLMRSVEDDGCEEELPTTFAQASDGKMLLASVDRSSSDKYIRRMDELTTSSSSINDTGFPVLSTLPTKRHELSIEAALSMNNSKSIPQPSVADLNRADNSTWVIAQSDKTLNSVLTRWAARDGWQLLWELPVDYSIDVTTSVHGSLEDAVSVVAKGMEGAEIPIKAIFYKGNKVLRIVPKGSK